MARTFTANMTTEVAKQYGSEPITVIEIQWANGGQRYQYADKDIVSENIKGRIADISNLDFVINVDDGSDSSEISLQLLDTDGHLNTILQTVDIHKKDVWVYQWFEGLIDFSDKALIFQGEINSPIVWSEGSRTLSFSVVSKIENSEVGFSIEEGNVPNPPEDLIGKAWPLKFGTTINVPALSLSSPAKGVLATGVGISDFTLAYRLSAAKSVICPQVFKGYKTSYLNNNLLIDKVYVLDETCALSRCERIQRLVTQITEQVSYEVSLLTIIGGEQFPQNEIITLDIDGGKFTGQFQGTVENPVNTFLVTAREHPDFAEIGFPTRESVQAGILARKQAAINLGCSHLTGGQVDGLGGITVGHTDPTDPSRVNLELSERSIEHFNAIPTANFFWGSPGSSVTLDINEPLVHVTNILPETVENVSAFRTFDGGRELVTVPSDYYTVRTSDFDTYTVTEVVLDTPLSLIDSSWDDELFITSISTIGPNTVDILTWLIQTYTDFNIDSVSFDLVSAAIENYPSDFPLLTRRNVLEVLREIAFQARCAIYLRDGTFYLVYLAQQPTLIETFTESDLDASTLELTHTDTEDITTKLVATWQRDYSLDVENKIILRHNVKKYGTHEREFEFYIYNELDYVHKSATFWLIRKSNTWRKLRFSTPIHKLRLETFDGVDLTLPDFSDETIRGLITKANYNSNSLSLDFEIWTPVKSGSTSPYNFAWPSQIDTELLWPTANELSEGNVGSGDAPGFSATPPSGHPLKSDLQLTQGFSFGPCATQASDVIYKSSPTGFSQERNVSCGNGNGDSYPSDKEDTKKVKNLANDKPADSPVDTSDIYSGNPSSPSFDGSNTSELESLKQQVKDLEKGVANAQSTANAANEATGGRGSGGQTPPVGLPLPGPDSEGLPACMHSVRVEITQPTVLYKTSGSAPPGFVGSSRVLRIDRFYFANKCEAIQFKNGINAAFGAGQAAESWQYTESYAWNALVTFNTDPDCAVSVPCDQQEQDEMGTNTGFLPEPIAYEQSITPGYEEDPLAQIEPATYLQDIIPLFDPATCLTPNSECDDEPDPTQEEIDSGIAIIPAGPTDDETWVPGDDV